MLEICERYEIEVVVPIVDEEVLLLSQNKVAFADKGVKIVASSHETVQNCNDKLKTYQALQKEGVETTPTWLLEEVEVHAVSFPLFAKPRKGLSSRGISLIPTAEDLQFMQLKSSDCVVQPYYPGTLYVVDVLNTLEGKNLYALPRIEHESKSGVGVKSTTTHNAKLVALAREVSEALGICGPANIEFIQSEDGEFHFIEINPRFSAGSILSTVAGVNIHQQALELFLGEDRDMSAEFHPGVTMTRFWQEVYYRDGQEFGSARDQT
ncbi:ATP-grasp domain-containing protein [Candidatus Woesebacteria bacterium]|nr:ATP-grasp domain-containing protein [Candidatus Woesebacteria bacterium]MCD8506848.1 ATP-grasp domain-containing protein [Candidatus Woesebacteria bacterium]MCD8527533.1 ATP-grasp domain-containing protein [Candidatus Woesebacteria bacterium]MCD8546273.1 ATP-grasp domain-containing protein [Candidatus Woesebacteria bacterium]